MTFPIPEALEPVAAALARLADLRADAGLGADARLGAAARLGAGAWADALAALGDLRAAVETFTVQMLGEVSGSTPEENPALIAGHKTVASYVAEQWRIGYPVARGLCEVGVAVSPGRSLLGDVLPAPYPVLADALNSGEGLVSVDQVGVVVREFEKASPGCSVEGLRAAEALIVEYAPSLTVEETRKLAVLVRDRVDEDGIEPREALQRRRRSLRVRATRNGMTHIDWYLDPESAGYVLAGIDTLTGAGMHKSDTREADPESTKQPDGAELPDGAGAGPMPDPRTLEQRRSDAATDVFRHLAGCSRAGTDHPPVTMMVTIPLDRLEAGSRTADIDGVSTPVSAATARRLAADANLIPVVLGTKSEVLDLGRADRLFSTAQKRALAHRDGGCAWAGCPHPPGYTQAHHLQW